MNKYIDADKLIAKIKRLKKEARKNALIAQDNNIPVCALWSGKERICTEILDIITSLQQEQPEVDLEKEIIRYQREDMDRDTTVGDVAHHFYELGLNARKDE